MTATGPVPTGASGPTDRRPVGAPSAHAPSLASGRHRPLLIALAALIVMPFALQAIGLTVTSSTDAVIFALAALGLNLLVGYTGLTSFGHGAWFGLGAYAAALAQRHWLPGSIVLPALFGVAFVAALSLVVGFLILRRRGVYFSLLTLAFSAMTFAIAFRWSSFTGGESGLGGVERPAVGPVNLDDARVYLLVVSAVALAVLYALLRVSRSPAGSVLVAIREHEQRARFQGYDTRRYKLLAFVLSATVTGVAGVMFVFHHRFASADPTSIAFSGELLAMVVIGGMRSFLGPALGALFYILFRELLSMYTENWLFWFGLLFVGFILFSPTGLIGIWQRLRAPFRPKTIEDAAMAARRVYAGLALPDCLRPPRPARGTVLEADGLCKSFGGIRAVDSVSVALRHGRIHALIGPNGAGKTTAFNLISGMFPPDAGQVRLNGETISGLSPDAICRRGLARSFQITNLFKGLTVYENLRLSVQAKHSVRFNFWCDCDDVAEVHRETREVIRFLGLEGIERVEAASLSYGGQRLLDVGIALGSKPCALLLDEPLAGLAAPERERVSELVHTMARDIPVLIVEHDIDRVFSFAHEVTVMNEGKVLVQGSPAEVRADLRVQRVYTGAGSPQVQGRTAAVAGTRETLLDYRGVDAFYGKSHILNQASLTVGRGEIVALLGRNGAGKSTLLKTVIGLLPPASGEIVLQGARIDGREAPEIARLGIGYIPQGRGLFAGMTVEENLQLGRLARAQTGTAWTDEQIFEVFPRLRERRSQPADYLSGGEQQMLAVARALAGDVKLLLLDEPFEGLAPAVAQELDRIFDRLRGEVSMLIVEHNLDLVLALADRAYVLERGSVTHQGPAHPLLVDLEFRKRILWL
jgi:branched-chain amino acid transport system ATP-binding protein